MNNLVGKEMMMLVKQEVIATSSSVWQPTQIRQNSVAAGARHPSLLPR
jgi:hypothetical protein